MTNTRSSRRAHGSPTHAATRFFTDDCLFPSVDFARGLLPGTSQRRATPLQAFAVTMAELERCGREDLALGLVNHAHDAMRQAWRDEKAGSGGSMPALASSTSLGRLWNELGGRPD
ncbi:MAG: hypothetical protein U0360_11725, partial [Dehalococcoidia bacterium]